MEKHHFACLLKVICTTSLAIHKTDGWCISQHSAWSQCVFEPNFHPHWVQNITRFPTCHSSNLSSHRIQQQESCPYYCISCFLFFFGGGGVSGYNLCFVPPIYKNVKGLSIKQNTMFQLEEELIHYCLHNLFEANIIV